MITKAKSDEPIRPLKNVKQFDAWQLPSLDTGDAPDFLQPQEEEEVVELSEEEKQEQLEEEIQSIREQARQEGFEQGREEGIAAGQKEIMERTQTLANLIEQLGEPVKTCGEKTQQALLQLAFAISRQIIRRELKQDPTQLIAIIREALKLLPVGSSDIVISLHPEDEAFVSSALSVSSDSEKNNWKIVSNPSIERGSCLVDTENSTVDASIDKQIAVLFSQMVGGQRAGESQRQNSEEGGEALD